MSAKFLPAALVLSLLAGCAPATQPEAPPPAPAPAPVQEAAPVRTSITDLAAFDAFIATRPTPTELRARYPGLTLVLPGDIATKELRLDNSRYFADLDAEGRISGGRFQ